ncbi:MAG: hypothetical protein LBI17_02255 [Rickettsiales bacterium]|nr:hypothetical protein [Rickettsiales bacterium]
MRNIYVDIYSELDRRRDQASVFQVRTYLNESLADLCIGRRISFDYENGRSEQARFAVQYAFDPAGLLCGKSTFLEDAQLELPDNPLVRLAVAGDLAFVGTARPSAKDMKSISHLLDFLPSFVLDDNPAPFDSRLPLREEVYFQENLAYVYETKSCRSEESGGEHSAGAAMLASDEGVLKVAYIWDGEIAFHRVRHFSGSFEPEEVRYEIGKALDRFVCARFGR